MRLSELLPRKDVLGSPKILWQAQANGLVGQIVEDEQGFFFRCPSIGCNGIVTSVLPIKRTPAKSGVLLADGKHPSHAIEQ